MDGRSRGLDLLEIEPENDLRKPEGKVKLDNEKELTSKSDSFKAALEREAELQARVELFCDKLVVEGVSPSYIMKQLKEADPTVDYKVIFDDKLQEVTIEKIPAVPNSILESMLLNGHLDETLRSEDVVSSLVRNLGYEKTYEILDKSDIYHRFMDQYEIPDTYQYYDDNGDLITVSPATEDDLKEMEEYFSRLNEDPAYLEALDQMIMENEALTDEYYDTYDPEEDDLYE